LDSIPTIYLLVVRLVLGIVIRLVVPIVVSIIVVLGSVRVVVFVIIVVIGGVWEKLVRHCNLVKKKKKLDEHLPQLLIQARYVSTARMHTAAF
jgi:hypothetical protein